MFEKIIGNENIKDLLKKSIVSNKVLHSYIFVGIDGIGKSLIAKEFAKAILCIENNTDRCNCNSCIKFTTNNNPDFVLIEPDNGSIKIDQIRSMQKIVSEKPIISNNKVCIINDADTMTIEAQNCLLKTLEEPPEYMTIILIGVNENNFLVTIKSRCTILKFEKINENLIQEYIMNNFENQTNINEILEIADGSIGRAINIKDKSEIYSNVDTILNYIEKYDIIETLKKADEIYKSKEEIFGILEYMNILLIKKARKNYKYAKCIEIIEETKKRIKSNSNYNMCIDYMLFSIWGEVNENYSRS